MPISDRILVAHATRYGATREVAEMVAAMKRMPVSDIRDWDAVRNWATGLVRTLVS